MVEQFEARQASYRIGSDGIEGPGRASKRMEPVLMNAFHQFCMEGRVFVANVGTETGAVNFTATALDDQMPSLAIDVPVGTTIIPLSVTGTWEASAGTDNEFIVGIASTLVGTATNTAITPYNIRTDQPKATACTCRSVYTAAGVDVTDAADNYLEIFRYTNAFADANTEPARNFGYSAMEASFVSVIKGAGSLVVFTEGTTTTTHGFITAVWAEFATAEVI